MNRRRGQIAALLTGLQVGLSMAATRALVDDIGPMTLALLRYGIGAAVLLPFFLRMRRMRIAAADLPVIALLGIGQFAVLIVLLNIGLARVTAAQGGVLFATFPLMTIALAAGLGRERLTALRVCGALAALLGVMVCLGASTALTDPTGAAFVLLAALTGAACTIYYRPYLQRYPTLQIGTLAMLAACGALAPGVWAEAGLTALAGLGVTSWALVGFIGLASGAGYLLWLTALRNTQAGEATVLMGISPIAATVVGAVWLREPVGAAFAAGLILTLAGVTMAIISRP